MTPTITMEAAVASVMGWMRAVEYVIQAAKEELPNSRVNKEEVAALARRYYREEWHGEHEVVTATGWEVYFARGYRMAMRLRANEELMDDIRYQLHFFVRSDIAEAGRITEKSSRSEEQKPRRPRQRAPKQP